MPAEAVLSLNEAIAEEATPTTKVGLLLVRAIIHSDLEDRDKEIADYTAVIDLPGASVKHVAKALVHRGLTHFQVGDYQHAVADYTAVTGLRGAPIEQVTKALFNRGITYRRLGAQELEIADYTTVIELPGATVEQVAKALVNRGTTHLQAGDYQHAVADYTAVICLPGASVEQIADALFGRGLTHLHNGRKDESMANFTTLISHPEAPLETVVHAHLILSENHFSDGRWSEGFQSLEASLDRGANAQPAYHGNPAGLIGVVFSAGLNPEGRRHKVTEFLRLYQKHQALPALGAAVVQHIGSIYRSGEPFPSSDNLEGWRSAWEQVSEGFSDFRLSIRLLNTSIAFLKSGGRDRSILLNLASAERSIVEQAFGINGEHR